MNRLLLITVLPFSLCNLVSLYWFGRAGIAGVNSLLVMPEQERQRLAGSNSALDWLGGFITALYDTDLLYALALCLGWFAAGAVFFALLIYLAWQALPADRRRTSPGRAVFFLAVPVIQIPWLFLVVYGWAKDYNRITADLKPSPARLPEMLFFGWCLLLMMFFIPDYMLLYRAVFFMLTVMLMTRICHAIDSLKNTAG